MTEESATSAPARVLSTSEGSTAEAFGPGEWGLFFGIAAIWGSSYLWVDIALESLRPGVIVAIRVLLGAAALSIFSRARKSVDRTDFPRIALLGLLWVGIPLSLFSIAQQWIDSAVAGMLNGAIPLMSAGWATILLRRWPGRIQIAGLAIGFAGVVGIAWPELSSARSTALGAGLVVVAIILIGLAANLAVPLQQRYGALPVLYRAQLVALIVVVPFGLIHLSGSTWAVVPVLSLLPLGVLSTGLAFVMMTNLLGRIGGTRGSVPIYLVPVIAIALGVAIRGETVVPLALIGALFVLIGAWLISRKERLRL